MSHLSLLGPERTWARHHVLLYCLPLFFIAMAETGMAYIFPLLVVNSGNSNTLLGLMLGASAFIGILTDLALPHIKKLRGWKAQLIVGLCVALLYPFFTWGAMASGLVLLFFVAAFSWYIFYELLMTSQQSFVVGEDKTRTYSKDWGEIYFTYTLASIAGPILAQSIDAISPITALFAMFFLMLVGLMFSILAAWLIKDHHRRQVPEPEIENVSNKTEFKYFRLFSSRIFPVMILAVLCLLVEQMFWDFGALLGESIHVKEELNWLIITLFSIPMLVGPLILTKFPIKNGKKRLAMLAVILGGLTLSLFSLTDYLPFLFGIIFVTGVLFSFTLPLGEAVYSDYLYRAGHSEHYLISLIRITASAGYLIAPVVGGFFSDRFGYKTTFAGIGLTVAAAALILLITTPKKIHLPQKELSAVENETITA